MRIAANFSTAVFGYAARTRTDDLIGHSALVAAQGPRPVVAFQPEFLCVTRLKSISCRQFFTGQPANSMPPPCGRPQVSIQRCERYKFQTCKRQNHGLSPCIVRLMDPMSILEDVRAEYESPNKH
jgi:hypothetical protein